jgi:hypothetical protein
MRLLRRGSGPGDLARFRPWRPADPTIDAPPQADWAWRPALWQGPLDPPERAATGLRTVLTAGAALHHDGQATRLRLVQTAAAGPGAPFAVTLRHEGAAPGFVSLALDLPADACPATAPHHLIRAAVRLSPADGTRAYLRLTCLRGPNADSRTAGLAPVDGLCHATIDLHGMSVAVLPPGRMWIDLIFEVPEGPVAITDVQLARVPRPPL